jgi:hypothetical protein
MFIHNNFTAVIHDSTEKNERTYRKGLKTTPTREMKPTLYSRKYDHGYLLHFRMMQYEAAKIATGKNVCIPLQNILLHF